MRRKRIFSQISLIAFSTGILFSFFVFVLVLDVVFKSSLFRVNFLTMFTLISYIVMYTCYVSVKVWWFCCCVRTKFACQSQALMLDSNVTSQSFNSRGNIMAFQTLQFFNHVLGKILKHDWECTGRCIVLVHYGSVYGSVARRPINKKTETMSGESIGSKPCSVFHIWQRRYLLGIQQTTGCPRKKHFYKIFGLEIMLFTS